MSPLLRLNLNQGSVCLHLPLETVQALHQSLGKLRERFKVTAGQTPDQSSPQPAWEFLSGKGTATDGIFFEAFCNPNIWPTPFAARVLLTIKDNQIQVRAETELTQLQDDLDAYLAQN